MLSRKDSPASRSHAVPSYGRKRCELAIKSPSQLRRRRRHSHWRYFNKKRDFFHTIIRPQERLENSQWPHIIMKKRQIIELNTYTEESPRQRFISTSSHSWTFKGFMELISRGQRSLTFRQQEEAGLQDVSEGCDLISQFKDDTF